MTTSWVAMQQVKMQAILTTDSCSSYQPADARRQAFLISSDFAHVALRQITLLSANR